MTSSTVTGLCRVRFHAPDARFELAVPADVPLLDLLPAVLAHASQQGGGDLDEGGIEHAGWVVQRLGGEALDEELTPAALGLRDGEDLYLRPRRAALPPVHFDDMVDGVTDGVRGRPDSWGPGHTRRLALGLAVTALTAGIALLLLPGPAAPRLGAAAATAVLLLMGAYGAGRTLADRTAGGALGVLAALCLAVAGALLPTADPGTPLLGARLLSGGSAAAGGAVLGLTVVAGCAPLFLGVAVAAAVTAGVGALALYGIPPQQGAAAAVVAAVLLGGFAPGLSFRLAGLRLPPLPRNAEELREGIEPVPSADVLARSAVADGYLTAFQLTAGAICTAGTALLATAGGWAPAALTGVLCLLLALHARAVGSVPQRLAVVLPAAFGLLLLTAHLALGTDGAGRLLLLSALSALGTVLALAAWTLPGRRLLPYWGRAADLLHTTAALALVPLALQVLGVFAALRAVKG
ncbi:type VII secretion integral membrane protein EccD [Streptomyces sp. WAC06614]|uniref:type VII secretion integral membrane protein EccD n=1 Tax=Streptomyces sp. WAC06614 TaxID=2487416 RepID=UPI0021B07D5C|nr:type VII secretion integral membrane protein EccD [Streptomyces sp. WAC06614]